MRLQADELTPHQYGDLVTVSNDNGESITMTLQKIAPDPDDTDTVELRGTCMGSSRRVILPPTKVVQIYGSDELPSDELLSPGLQAEADAATAGRLAEYLETRCTLSYCSRAEGHPGAHGSVTE